MRFGCILCLFTLQLFAHQSLCNVATLTGVPLELMGYYSGLNFECLDKSRTIQTNEVNDDYCDCKDGSDEPGTSACNNSRFFCQNEGFHGKFIPSNWVNDGHCDCCDASDEYGPHVVGRCNNTCADKAVKMRERVDKMKVVYEKGHEIYKTWSSTAEELVKKRFEDAVAEREETIRRRTEEAQKDFEDRKAKALEKIAERERRKLEPEEPTASVDENATSTLPEPNEQIPEPDFDPSAEADKLMRQEEEAQAEGFDTNLQAPPVEENESKNEEPRDGEQTSISQPVEEEEIVVPTGPDPIIPVPEVKLPDYGPKNVFVHLIEQSCFTYDENEYTYKLCPFQGAYQLPRGSSHSETSLGAWGRWVNTDVSNSISKPLEMVYENGQGCWNGPARSTNVILQCGEENKILSASEPSRCQYQLIMTSPGACHVPGDVMMEQVMAHETKHDDYPHDEL